mgnify:FL=1
MDSEKNDSTTLNQLYGTVFKRDRRSNSFSQHDLVDEFCCFDRQKVTHGTDRPLPRLYCPSLRNWILDILNYTRLRPASAKTLLLIDKEFARDGDHFPLN